MTHERKLHLGILFHFWVNHSRKPHRENSRPVTMVQNVVTGEKAPAVTSTNLIDSEWARISKSIPSGLAGRTPADRTNLDEHIRAGQWRRMISTGDHWRAWCDAAADWLLEMQRHEEWKLARLHKFSRRLNIHRGRQGQGQPGEMAGERCEGSPVEAPGEVPGALPAVLAAPAPVPLQASAASPAATATLAAPAPAPLQASAASPAAAAILAAPAAAPLQAPAASPGAAARLTAPAPVPPQALAVSPDAAARLTAPAPAPLQAPAAPPDAAVRLTAPALAPLQAPRLLTPPAETALLGVHPDVDIYAPRDEVQEEEVMESVRAPVLSLIGYDLWGTVGSMGDVRCHNIGNTCFVNACIRALSCVSAVKAWSMQHKARCSRDGVLVPCVLCRLGEDMETLSRGCAELYTPRLAQYRTDIRPHFHGRRQQCAYDCLQGILSESQEVDKTDFENLRVAVNASVHYALPSWVLFGGVSSSKVACRRCGYTIVARGGLCTAPEPQLHLSRSQHPLRVSKPLWYTCKKYERFTTLSLQMIRLPRPTLQSSFQRWCAAEKLEEAFRCDRCHVRGTSGRTQDIERWPANLIVHLHRLLRVKDDRFVGFDACWVPCQGVTYDLVALVRHIGESGLGHYVCYGRGPTSEWARYDDEVLPEGVDVATVLLEQAFILIYARR